MANTQYCISWEKISEGIDDPCRIQAKLEMTNNFAFIGFGNTPRQALECLLKGLEDKTHIGHIDRKDVNFQPEDVPSKAA